MNPGKRTRHAYWLRPTIISTVFVAVLLVWLLSRTNRSRLPAIQIHCIQNMKQIGLAFALWSNDNQNQFPFNLSTNQGGTREWCDRNTDGFDRNGFRHLMVMTGQLSTTEILICPLDSTSKLASDFEHLGPTNVTYQIRSGTNVNERNPDEMLAICPLHGNVLYCDGRVQKGRAPRIPLAIREQR